MRPFSTNFCKMPLFTDMEFLYGIILVLGSETRAKYIMKNKYIELLQKKI